MANKKKFNQNDLKNDSCPRPSSNAGIKPSQIAAQRPNQRAKSKRPGPGTKSAASE